MRFSRSLDIAARYAGFLFANGVVVVALCWCGFHLQQEGFAPAVVFPLLVGGALGAAGIPIARVTGVPRAVAVGGTACLGLLAVVGQDYISHRHHVRAYEESLRAQDSPAAALLAQSAVDQVDFRPYLVARVGEHPVWWGLDVALTVAAAAVVSAAGTRRAHRAGTSDEERACQKSSASEPISSSACESRR